MLAFLPGEGEIRRVAALLADSGLPADTSVHALYGALPPAEQDAAIRPAATGRRKVVLATTIAETSLTIEGIRVVVDGGQKRAPRFDPRTGMTRLETVRVSAASADQRRGRAGRLEPGVCYRLVERGGDARLCRLRQAGDPRRRPGAPGAGSRRLGRRRSTATPMARCAAEGGL